MDEVGVPVAAVPPTEADVVKLEIPRVLVIAYVVSETEVTVTDPSVVMLGVSVVKGSVVGLPVSTISVVMVSVSVKVSVVKVVTKSSGLGTLDTAMGSMANGDKLRETRGTTTGVAAGECHLVTAARDEVEAKTVWGLKKNILSVVRERRRVLGFSRKGNTEKMFLK